MGTESWEEFLKRNHEEINKWPKWKRELFERADTFSRRLKKMGTKRLIAIDPGLNGCGLAMFDDLLVYATYVKETEGLTHPNNKLLNMQTRINDMIGGVCGFNYQVVCELPQVYTQGKLKGDPNDLINLALIVGGIHANYKTQLVKPREWKGQMPKEVCNQRVLSKLSPEEKEVIDKKIPKSLLHNTLDAVGIGLWALGRL